MATKMGRTEAIACDGPNAFEETRNVMFIRKPLRFLSSFALILIVSFSAVGVCPTGSTAEEQMLWAVHNCDGPFRTWFRDSYNLKSEHWGGGWGWDECNPDFAFPKMLNAGYLIANGVDHWNWRPWHSSSDYSNWGNAHQDDFHYKPVDEPGFASAYGGVFYTDRVEMKCGGINTNAAERASTMLHEATHIVYWNYDHQANNPGSNCFMNEPCSDDWLFHYLSAYPYGNLPDHKHSMTQIEVEFLCDLAQFRQPWVPVTIAQFAESASNDLMLNRILDIPGWICGTDRPLPDPPPDCPVGKKCCVPTPTGCAEDCIPESAACQ